MSIQINKQVRAFLTTINETFEAIDNLNSIEQATAEAIERLRSTKELEAQSKVRADEFLIKARDEYKSLVAKAEAERVSIMSNAGLKVDAMISEANKGADYIVAKAQQLFKQADEAVVIFNDNQSKIANQNDLISKNTAVIADQTKRLRALQDSIAAIAASARNSDGA